MAALANALILPPLCGWSVDWFSFLPGFQIGIIFLIFWPYTRWRNMDRITVSLETVVAGILMTVPVLIISYATTRTAFPLADARLEKLDLAFGFNWVRFIAFVDSSFFLERTLRYAYQAFAPQLLLIPIMLDASGQFRRAYQFIFGYVIICIICCVIFIGFPALGSYQLNGVTADDLNNLTGHLAYIYIDALIAVRNEPNFVLSIENAHGIITFPSIHAAIAVLSGWAMWRTIFLRWIFLQLILPCLYPPSRMADIT